MDETIKKLQKELEIISKKGYIKGIYNNSASVGRTLEHELNLQRNTLEIPDYEGIEIKTRRTYSKSYITLFTAVPDGIEQREMERLKNTFGYPYKNDKKYKALYADVYGNRKNYAGVKYQYKLDVDREKQKIFLCVYDRYDNLIERKIYWSFIYLESKLMLKLQTLALVNVWPKQINGWNYFNYYKNDFYILKDFDTFIDLIEIGIIKITLKIDIYKDEIKYGKTYDHGCGFCIQESNIMKLYTKYHIK